MQKIIYLFSKIFKQKFAKTVITRTFDSTTGDFQQRS